jgi:hypothetical protein
VLPGTYRVRLTHDGRVATQRLEVVMDPRVRATRDQLETLFAFQGDVEDALARGVEQARGAAQADREVTRAVGALTALAKDLGHADAPPTEAQRALFAEAAAALGVEK